MVDTRQTYALTHVLDLTKRQKSNVSVRKLLAPFTQEMAYEGQTFRTVLTVGRLGAYFWQVSVSPKEGYLATPLVARKLCEEILSGVGRPETDIAGGLGRTFQLLRELSEDEVRQLSKGVSGASSS